MLFLSKYTIIDSEFTFFPIHFSKGIFRYKMFAWSNNWYIRIRRQLCAEKVKTSENARMGAGKPGLSNTVIRKEDTLWFHLWKNLQRSKSKAKQKNRRVATIRISHRQFRRFKLPGDFPDGCNPLAAGYPIHH